VTGLDGSDLRSSDVDVYAGDDGNDTDTENKEQTSQANDG
jgi:hypothetical protein